MENCRGLTGHRLAAANTPAAVAAQHAVTPRANRRTLRRNWGHCLICGRRRRKADSKWTTTSAKVTRPLIKCTKSQSREIRGPIAACQASHNPLAMHAKTITINR